MIFYRTAGAWGSGVGANLSAAQVDQNFYDVATRVQFLELNPGKPIQITSFNAAGNQLYINMSDGSTHGPLALPVVRWRPRGPWAPNTIYNIDDLIVGPDSATYLTIFTHTSGTTFSPNANDGLGHQFYSLLLQVPAMTIPSGGNTGSVLTKGSPTDFDMSWRFPTAPQGGYEGQTLLKNSNQDGDVYWGNVFLQDIVDVQIYGPLSEGDYLRYSATVGQWINQPRPMLNVVKASSWAPVLGDEGIFMVIQNGTGTTSITIPRNSEQNFPIGAELHIHQNGTGPVRIFAESGVQLLWHQDYSNQLLGQYATVTVKKTDFDEWRLFGLLAGV